MLVHYPTFLRAHCLWNLGFPVRCCVLGFLHTKPDTDTKCATGPEKMPKAADCNCRWSVAGREGGLGDLEKTAMRIFHLDIHSFPLHFLRWMGSLFPQDSEVI